MVDAGRVERWLKEAKRRVVKAKEGATVTGSPFCCAFYNKLITRCLADML